MPVYEKKSFLSHLVDRTELISSNTRTFLRCNYGDLNLRPAADKWSIAEIFEHLYITHRISLDQILQRISKAPDVKASHFQTGWLGDFIYERTMPRADGSLFRLRTPGMFQPKSQAYDGREVLERFLQQQDTIHDVLQHAFCKDLKKIKVPLPLTRLISLRLGDNLRIIIAHNERHILQAQRILEARHVVQAI